MIDNTNNKKKNYTTKVGRLKRTANNRNSNIELLEGRLKELKIKKLEVDRRIEEADKRRAEWESKKHAAWENKYKYQIGNYFLNQLKDFHNNQSSLNDILLNVMLNEIYKTIQNKKEEKLFIDTCNELFGVVIADTCK